MAYHDDGEYVLAVSLHKHFDNAPILGSRAKLIPWSNGIAGWVMVECQRPDSLGVQLLPMSRERFRRHFAPVEVAR